MSANSNATKQQTTTTTEAEEKEEDRLLEEEEFTTSEADGLGSGIHDAPSFFTSSFKNDGPQQHDSATPNVLHAYQNDHYYYLPFSFKMVLMANHLERELARLRYSLVHEAQFMISKKGSGTVKTDEVLQTIFQERLHEMEKEDQQKSGSVAAAMRLLTQPPSAAELQPYASWHGSSFLPVQMVLSWFQPSANVHQHNKSKDKNKNSNAALVTLTAGVDHIRRMKSLHTVGSYQKLNLRPRKQIFSSCVVIAWNALIGVVNAATVLVCMTVRGAKGLSARDRAAAAAAKNKNNNNNNTVVVGHNKLVGAVKGLYEGITAASTFLFLSCVLSPLLHLSTGVCHSLLCFVNIFTSHVVFDARTGRWERNSTLNIAHFRREWQLEKRVLRAVGRQEFKRGKLKTEKKWNERFAAMGFSVDAMREKLLNNNNNNDKDSSNKNKSQQKEKNPYDVLGVARNATPREIKRKYKTLAMIYHPDVAEHQPPQQPHSTSNQHHHTFEDISTAYQVLSNPEKRKAYDVGGQKGLDAHEQQYGSLHNTTRTPEEIVQHLFGGNAFRQRIFGEVLRSHWSLKFEAQVSVSIHDFEILQSIRTKQVALELVKMVDVHAQRPYSPYVPRHGGSPQDNGRAASATAHRRVVHKVQLGGLPDPITGQRAGVGAGARSPRGGRRPPPAHSGAAAGVEKDMQEHIQQELGGQGAASAASGQKQQQEAAAAAASRSPFELYPGSNVYNCFSHDFEDRVERLVDYLAKSCFGPELLHEVGEAYIVHAQRYLHIRPFYASKWQVWRKVFTGLDKMWDAATLKLLREEDKAAPSSSSSSSPNNNKDKNEERSPRKKAQSDVQQQQQRLENARRIIVEYVGMEFDSVVADFNVILKNATQIVLRDTTVSAEVRQRRCYALWYIGTVMQKKGRPWNETHTKENKKQSDIELITYVQQAATAPATTAPPPAF